MEIARFEFCAWMNQYYSFITLKFYYYFRFSNKGKENPNENHNKWAQTFQPHRAQTFAPSLRWHRWTIRRAASIFVSPLRRHRSRFCRAWISRGDPFAEEEKVFSSWSVCRYCWPFSATFRRVFAPVPFPEWCHFVPYDAQNPRAVFSGREKCIFAVKSEGENFWVFFPLPIAARKAALDLVCFFFFLFVGACVCVAVCVGVCVCPRRWTSFTCWLDQIRSSWLFCEIQICVCVRVRL